MDGAFERRPVSRVEDEPVLPIFANVVGLFSAASEVVDCHFLAPLQLKPFLALPPQRTGANRLGRRFRPTELGKVYSRRRPPSAAHPTSWALFVHLPTFAV